MTDEVLLYIFDNVREILEFQNKEITRQNVNLINVELYNALQRKDNLCRFLNGEFMRVYIIDMENDLKKLFRIHLIMKKSIITSFILFLISIYQKISRHTPPVCRFYPTCSEYTRQAIEKYGAVKGSMLAGWRILRCNPFSKGGYDPVPRKK